MHRHEGGGARRLQRRHQIVGDAAGIGHRHARMPAHHFHMRDFRQAGSDLGDTARAEDERVAAGQDHFPYFRMIRDIGNRRREIIFRQGVFVSGSDHLATETEAAIDRTGRHRLEKHAVGMAMDDAGDAGMGVIADGVGPLLRQRVQFLQRREELAGDGIGGVGRIDQRQQRRRHCHRIAPRDLLKG